MHFVNRRKGVLNLLAVALLLAFNLFIPSLASSQGGDSSAIDSLTRVVAEETRPLALATALVELAANLYISNPDTMIVLCERSLDIINANYETASPADKLDFDQVRSSAFTNIGYIHSLQGRPREALEYYEQALSMKQSIKDTAGEISTLNNMALLLTDQGNLLKALDLFHQTRALAEILVDPARLATCHNNIGYVYYLHGEYEPALSHYRLGLKYNSRTNKKDNLASLFNNIGVIYLKTNRLDSAHTYFDKSLQIRGEIDDKYGLANSHVNLGKTIAAQGDTIHSLEHFQQALQIAHDYQFPKLESAAIEKQATILLSQGRIGEVRPMIPRLKEIWTQIGTPQMAVNYSTVALKMAVSEGDWKSAFEMQELKGRMEDSVASQEQRMEIIRRDQEIQYLKEKSVSDQALALETERKKRFQVTTLMLGMGLILVVALGWITLRSVQSKKALTQAQLVLARLEHEKMELEMDRKSHELTGYSLRIAQTGQMLYEIDELLKKANSSQVPDYQELLTRLKTKIKETTKKDHDWADFQKQFATLHPGFVPTLRSQYPQLTTHEIRLCCLIKLDLTSTEIIALLGITKDTLKSSRYRIHKKMGLPTGHNLSKHLLEEFKA